ncbi:MAG TPA: GntR family transcriptional regulator [Acetobacteraceae bacterium]
MSGSAFARSYAPLYRDIANALERRISSGEWKAGQRIPTEVELEALFGASRGTVRIAVAELVRKGLLHRQAGRGTFVLGPDFADLTRFFRFERNDSDAPIVPEAEELESAILPADEGIARALGLAPGDSVAHVRRLRRHRGEPFLLIDSYFTMTAWQQISTADFNVYPFYDLLRSQFGFYIIAAEEFLTAGLATEEEARLLAITRGDAIVRLERIACSFGEERVEFRRCSGRGDKFRYHVRLR